MKQEKSCGAIVFRRFHKQIQVLIIQQIQGHYCFPKGHVEDNETEKQTAKREIKEETGLNVKFIKGFKHSLSYSPKKNIKKEVVYFLAILKGGKEKIQKDELLDLKWLSIKDAKKIITYDNDKELLDHALIFLSETYLEELM